MSPPIRDANERHGWDFEKHSPPPEDIPEFVVTRKRREGDDAAFLSFLAQALKARLSIGEVRKDMFCPVCGTNLICARAAVNGRLRASCARAGCLNFFE